MSQESIPLQLIRMLDEDFQAEDTVNFEFETTELILNPATSDFVDLLNLFPRKQFMILTVSAIGSAAPTGDIPGENLELSISNTVEQVQRICETLLRANQLPIQEGTWISINFVESGSGKRDLVRRFFASLDKNQALDVTLSKHQEPAVKRPKVKETPTKIISKLMVLKVNDTLGVALNKTRHLAETEGFDWRVCNTESGNDEQRFIVELQMPCTLDVFFNKWNTFRDKWNRLGIQGISMSA